MKLAAALIYWVIVAVWLVVLTTVVVFYFRKGRTFGATRMLLAVVGIDTFRNIAENVYFGVYFDAQYGFLPSALIGALGQPIFLIIPKILNVASGGLVMSILLLRWLPQAVRERKILQLDADVQRKLATIDSMTGLLNRRQFFVVAEVERERSRRYRRPLSMLMIDIDGFKSINDSFGHDVGDEVIVLVANVCQSLTRSTDLIARLGGEEFALLLPETGLKDAGELAERLREAVSKITVAEADGLFTPTVSIGVSEAADGTLISDLLKRADVALYDAKHAGRNRVSLFDPARVRQIGALSSTPIDEPVPTDVKYGPGFRQNPSADAEAGKIAVRPAARG
jgi:diguanylate cyclase (GGDEF)-like protein